MRESVKKARLAATAIVAAPNAGDDKLRISKFRSRPIHHFSGRYP
jgi:hypothetical protein